MRGRPPTITGSGAEDKHEKRFASWKNPGKMPNDTSKQKMLKEALKIALKIPFGAALLIFQLDSLLLYEMVMSCFAFDRSAFSAFSLYFLSLSAALTTF